MAAAKVAEEAVWSQVKVTDKLKSYAATKRKTKPCVEHCQHKGLNNRGPSGFPVGS